MLRFISIIIFITAFYFEFSYCKQTLTELIYGNEQSTSNLFEPITLTQLSTYEPKKNQQFSKLQIDNQKLDEDLMLLVKSEEEEKLNKTKSKKIKQQKLQEIVDGEATKTPIPEDQLIVQADQQIPNITNENSTNYDNSTGIFSTIFKSVTNYLFENGTGAFFQLKQFNQNTIPNNETENQDNNRDQIE